ncbi:MAG: tetratricopeptide repeat protein [Cyanobacteriota bacterium]
MCANELYKVHHRLGNLNYRKSDFSKAIECYQKALDLFTQDYKVYYDLASAYYSTKEFELSIINYKEALSLKPNDLYSKNGLAVSYLAIKNFEEARELAEEIMEVDKRLAKKILDQIENQG